MSESIFTQLEQHLHPLMRAAERMGAMRALLAASTHIDNEIKRGNLKITPEVVAIVEALNDIRITVYKDINDKPGYEEQDA